MPDSRRSESAGQSDHALDGGRVRTVDRRLAERALRVVLRGRVEHAREDRRAQTQDGAVHAQERGGRADLQIKSLSLIST